jgi:uncharacterized Zn finger protein (UPF0148 family)
VAWDLPIDKACSFCGTQLSEKTYRGGNKAIVCPNKECSSNQKEPKKTAKRTTSKNTKTKKPSTKKTSTKKTSTKKPVKKTVKE